MSNDPCKRLRCRPPVIAGAARHSRQHSYPAERDNFARLGRRTVCSPLVHQLAALLEKVPTAVGGFGFVLDHMGQGRLAHLVGKRVHSAAQSRKAGAETMHGCFSIFIRRSTISRAMLDTGFRAAGAKTKSPLLIACSPFKFKRPRG